MSDEPEHKSPLEIIVGRCLPERLRNDEKFMEGLGGLCGLAAGWIIGRKVVEWLFPRGDDK